MKIELILLGIIGVVFLIDFLMKGVKKKTESNDMVKADEEEVNIPKQRKGRYIYYLYAFVGSIIIGIISTYLIDYFYSGISAKNFIHFTQYNTTPSIINFTISFGTTLILLSFVLYKEYSLFTIKSTRGSALLYILKRKKNITLFIISSSILKLGIHYFMYTAYLTVQSPNLSNKSTGKKVIYKHFKDFTYHVENIFTIDLHLFIPALIICSLIVWFFNDKIKAR